MLVWAAFAGPLTSTGHGKPGKGYGYGGKVIICHHAGKHKQFEIVVSQSAVAAHLAHGDTLGICRKHHGKRDDHKFKHHKVKHKAKFHKAKHKAKYVVHKKAKHSVSKAKAKYAVHAHR
jgi:hypothetical protein